MEQRIALEEMGKKILESTRTDLYLSMRYMGAALSSLDFVMDLSTPTVGTDAAYIRFHPNFLRQIFLERPRRLNRIYMHMLMHCLFRHMFAARYHDDPELWDLCCDIAVESVIDTMDYPAIAEIVSDQRAKIYQDLEAKVKVLTAEKLYQLFTDEPVEYFEQCRLQAIFGADDHNFWARLDEEENQQSPNAPDQELPPPQGGEGPKSDKEQKEGGQTPKNLQSLGQTSPREDTWKKNAERVRADLSSTGSEASDKTGSLERILSFEVKRRTDYREFLQKFSVLREETGIDPDSFDYGFYNLGLSMYGNMPLIEENEYREAKKVDELVIAIDTSASCQSSLVAKFLNDTADILLGGDHFFRDVNIHIVSCDDKVQADTVITKPQQMRRYADGFTLKGGYGTDFRPVFAYVEQLRREKKLTNVRGLLYFTDGFGTYPKKAPDYETAFVFRKDEPMGDADVPAWALKLYV